VAVAFIGAETTGTLGAVTAVLRDGRSNGHELGLSRGFLEAVSGRLILLTVVVFGIRWVARFNLLGWFLVIVCTGMLGAGLELTGQPDAFYRSQGYIVVTAIGGTAGVATGVVAAAVGESAACGVSSRSTWRALPASKGTGRTT